MTQDNIILNIFEKICRSNVYLFIISRFLIGKYLSRIIYDSDFKIIRILERNKLFVQKKIILDIGANDGMSYNIIRKFTKTTKIISFEPIKHNFNKLKKIEKNDKFFKCFNFALSSQNKNINFFLPYFKKYPLLQFAGINKAGVINRLKASFNVKDILKKVNLKKSSIKPKILDDLKLNPCFIKIDIEGHELECIQGSLKTVRKNNPIIMVEYDKKICDKIFTILKKYSYQKYFYNKKNQKIEKFNNQKVFNIFFINKKLIKFIDK